ncbi:hypothetical protein ACFFK0_07660 [Paenibacillus chartarius]|uniref:DUF3139 domain-containing protein n=1 Tax=Paenibacillus chartarius TaxID=747481 RepID=A0ABV6DI99_9BACL
MPYYGYISMFVLLVTFILVFWSFVRYSNSKMIPSKKLIIIIITSSVISTVLYFQAKDEKHRNEITSEILRTGGTIISIEATERGSTPFKEIAKSKARKKDDYYIVTYSINDQIKKAWFKGDNGIFQDPPTPFADKWIFK